MNNKIYVGNLPYSVTSESLAQMFANTGSVTSAMVISDKMTGRSKGFGFVEFATEEDAQNAIKEFDGKDVDGRPLKVSIARPKEA